VNAGPDYPIEAVMVHVGYPDITIDYEANCAYVALIPNIKSAKTIELGYGINVDLDERGHPVGYEILNLKPPHA
jgi:uncharacterized protein YuzE